MVGRKPAVGLIDFADVAARIALMATWVPDGDGHLIAAAAVAKT